MKQKPFLIYTSIFLFFVVYHLITLSISPVVWIDEVTINSINLDYIQHGTFYFIADKTWGVGNGLNYYGPVFFMLNGWILEMFSNGIFQGRFLELISGLAVVFVFTYSYALKKLSLMQYLLFVCVFLDPFFSSSMHRGRFDLLALLFFLMAMISLLGNPIAELKEKKKFTVIRSLLAGALYGLALLTHIRLMFFAGTFAVVFLIEFIQSKENRKNTFYCGLAFAFALAGMYVPWIFYEFGGFKQYVDAYVLLTKYAPLFVGSEQKILPEVMPLFLVFISTILLMLLYLKKFISSKWLWMNLTMIVSFFIFIKDTGYYSILIIPCFYIAIMICLEQVTDFNKYFKWLCYVAVIGLFFIYSGTFILKGNVLITDYANREPELINKFIAENIPAGAKVCTDEFYYYSVLKNKNDLHLYYSFQAEAKPEKEDSTYIQVEKYSREKFQYDYLVIADVDVARKPKLFDVYFNAAQLDTVARFDPPQQKIPDWLKYFAVKNLGKTGYQGTIYKRRK